MKSWIVGLFVFCCNLACAQHTKDVTGNWLMYFGLNRVAENWSIHSEIQYRNHTIEPINIEQLLLRTGLASEEM